MNLFEKIKSFFKNIGKKQQALPEPEMIEEIPVEAGSKQFKEEIKFDPKDLLDPRVCQGKYLIPNILKTLGVKNDVLENPEVMTVLESAVSDIIIQSGMNRTWADSTPFTKAEINAVVNAIKRNGTIDYTKLKDTANREHRPDNFTKLSITEHGIEIQRANYGTNGYAKFDSINVVNSGSRGYGQIQMCRITEKMNNWSQIVSVTERNVKKYENGIQTFEEDCTLHDDNTTTHTRVTRDSEFPLVAKLEELDARNVNIRLGMPLSSPVEKTSYYPINTDYVTTLRGGMMRETDDGKCPIIFDDRGQVAEYCVQNKQEMAQACVRDSESWWACTPEQKQSMRFNLKYFAQKAGILPKEKEAEIQN